MMIAGAKVTQVPLSRGDSGWSLDINSVFAACGPDTKLLYLASPANPTGWMISGTEAEALLRFARERRIAILSDEVYHRIVYDQPVAFSFLEIAEPDDAVFVVNSFSKSWAMTGWRIGWLISPRWFLDATEKLIQFNTSGGQAFLQYGAVAALDCGEEFVANFVERCARGRAILARRLSAMPHVRQIPSNGSFYAMIEIDGVKDTLGICKRMAKEARIGFAPGSAFGMGAETLIRLCFAKSEDSLEEAMDRLGRYLTEWSAHSTLRSGHS
jgi:aspartate/methionine/tyrosine aminotransferase